VTKSPEDLKAILRTMTTKTSAEREEKQTKNQQSLKGALAEVLQKSKPAEPASSEEQKPAEAKPPRENPPGPVPPPAQTLPLSQEKKPFEVPEETLRKVLKGES